MDTLERVVSVYQDALERGIDVPQKYVAAFTGYPNSTVSYNLRKARAMGLLPPSWRKQRAITNHCRCCPNYEVKVQP